ncbi:MAG: hypothetical protein HY866_08140 [Chloroflexi bacterium]|nr:hypothetical protein [Chloroflexota bacterium]
MKRLQTLTGWPFYVWFFVLYPVLYLYAHNIALVESRDVLVAIVLALAAVTVIFGGLLFIFKDTNRAGIITTLLSLVFFSYGHIFRFLNQRLIGHFELTHQITFPVTVLLTGIGIYILFRFGTKVNQITSYLNITTVILLLFPIYEVVSFVRLRAEIRPITLNPVEAETDLTGELPDIYYIILDAYGRADWLQEQFGFDNSNFINELSERGFYIGTRSCSNYTRTLLSIPSALSMDYVDVAGVEDFGRSASTLFTSRYLEKNDRVGNALITRGYTYLYFVSGFVVTNSGSKNAVRIDFGPSGTFAAESNTRHHFWNTFLPTTLIGPFYEYQEENSGNSYSWTSPNRILMELNELKETSLRDEPTFTFAHIVKPHYPYVFNEDGTLIPKPAGWEQDDDLRAKNANELYIEQVRFINRQILDVVDEIIANSETPPIIILQGDHAWNAQNMSLTEGDRVPILNAYLVPPEMEERLYSSISPVNSFRLLFDTSFGANLGLLEDKSFTSQLNTPLNVRAVSADTYQTWCETSTE